MDTEIRHLLEGAVRQTDRPVDITDVQRRVSRRRRTRAAGAVVALLLAVPVTIEALPLSRPAVTFGAPGSEPGGQETQPPGTSDGKFFVVRRFTIGGEVRELVAYRRSDKEVCVGTRDLEQPRNLSSGCGYGVPVERLLGLDMGVDAAGITLAAPVAKRVADVQVELHDGTLVDAGPYTGGDRFPVNFYLATLPPETKVRAIVGFDSDGKEVERQRVRPIPPWVRKGVAGRSAKAQLADDAVTGATPRAAATGLARELGREKLRVRNVLRIGATDTRVMIHDTTGCWVYAASDPDEDGTWSASGGDMPCDP